MDSQVQLLSRVKKLVFSLLFILDSTKYTDRLVLLWTDLAELSLVHYFYFHPCFLQLRNLQFFSIYLDQYRSYLFLLVPSYTLTVSIATMLLLPLTALLLILQMRMPNTYLLILVVSTVTLLLPLLLIKFVIETINIFSFGPVWLGIGLTLTIPSCLFMLIALTLYSKTIRCVDIVCVLLLEMAVTPFAVIPVLVIRLILYCRLAPRQPAKFIKLSFEFVFLVFILSAYACEDSIVNYIAFASLAIVTVTTVALKEYLKFRELHYSKSRSDGRECVLSLIDKLQEKQSLQKIRQYIEEHRHGCACVQCRCHTFPTIETDALREWILAFEQEDLKKGQQFSAVYLYAQRCCTHFNYKMAGLVAMHEQSVYTLVEQYERFAIGCAYEANMRRLDRNYIVGDHYLHVQEEIHNMHIKLEKIITMIHEFWKEVQEFDGSGQFFKMLLTISASVGKLRHSLRDYEDKYDDNTDFKYVFGLFESVVLNKDLTQDEDITIPQDVICIVSHKEVITMCNNSFSKLVELPIHSIIGKKIDWFIPEPYRATHAQLHEKLIEESDSFESRILQKFLYLGGYRIKQIEMTHKILPRFDKGIQVFSTLKTSSSNPERNFIMLVDRQTLAVMLWEDSFIPISQLRVDTVNLRQLCDLPLTRIFSNFDREITSKDTPFADSFLKDFTAFNSVKEKRATRRAGPPKPQISFVLLEYQILPSKYPDDPCLSVHFKLKGDQQVDLSSSTLNEPEEVPASQLDKGKISSIFRVAYHLAFPLILLHLVYISAFSSYSSFLQINQNKSTFLQLYSLTILESLSCPIGSNQLPRLKKLWISGYGDFPESFTSFESLADPLFQTYFMNTFKLNYNSLFSAIQQDLTQFLVKQQLVRWVVLAIGSTALLLTICDMVMSLKYMIHMEQQVASILVRFLSMSNQQITEIFGVLKQFKEQVLHKTANEPEIELPPPVTQENSLMSLTRTDRSSITSERAGSISHRGSQSNSLYPNKRMSMALLKSELGLGRMSIQFSQLNQSYKLSRQKQQKIRLFEQSMGRLLTIAKSNTRQLVCLVFVNLFMFFLIAFTTYRLLHCCDAFSSKVLVINQMETVRLTLLKPNIEIITGQTLLPETSISVLTATLLSSVNALPESLGSFQDSFKSLLLTNACFFISKRGCSAIVPNSYGLNVIEQQIEQYYRKANSQTPLSQHLESNLINQTAEILSAAIQSFAKAISEQTTSTNSAEFLLIAAGTIGLMLSLYLSSRVLKHFQSRVQLTEQLYEIIPSHINNKSRLRDTIE